MTSKETVTLYDDNDLEMVVSGTFEWFDNETTEAGTVNYGGECFYVESIKQNGVERIDEFSKEQIAKIANRVLENIE